MSQVPYQLLELSIISAQDLAPVFKNLRTYALTWIKPDRKLRTRTDQQGRANPTWNDKFVFRVDDAVLNSDASFVIIEIYAVGWLKDSLVGSVSVAVTNLIPPSVRSERRFVALQIRRPSGRPQGILNMGVSLLDNTMRSMPLCTELSGSTVGFSDLWIKEEIATEKEKKQSPETIRLLRSSSDRTDLTSTIQGEGNKKKKTTGSACNYGNAPTGIGSVMDNGFGSVVTDGGNGGGGSMVNGSVVNSDVGPSASVVMAAVAMGLYPIHHGPSPKPGSSVLEDWTVAESAAEEGLKTRIERWRMDLAQGHDPKYQRLENGKRKQKKHRHQRRRSVNGEEEEDEGKFTCFGNACGCEFTIVCGGGGKNKKGGNKKNRRRGYNTSCSKTSDSELCS